MDLIQSKNLNAVEKWMFDNHIPIQKNLCLARNPKCCFDTSVFTFDSSLWSCRDQKFCLILNSVLADECWQSRANT